MKQALLQAFAFLSKRYGQSIIQHRMMLVIGTQLCLIMAANFVSFFLRFEGDIPSAYRDMAFQTVPIVLAIYMAGLWAFDLFRGLWRYVGIHDLARILWASIISTIVLYGLVRVPLGWTAYPRSVVILTGLLTAGFLAGIRLAIRALREWLQIVGPTARRVLIVGAGNAGELLVRDLQTNPSYNYKPVGFVDDDPVKQKAKIHGIPVLGTISETQKAVERSEAQEIIVAIPSATPQLMQRILTASEACRLPIKTLPNVKQLLDSAVSMRQVRPVSLEDLLQREPIKTDLQELHPLLEGKRVLVTGAGGAIGSELCRQIARYRPALLVLFERHENSLYALDLELRETYPQLPTKTIVGDATVPELVADVFRTCAPQLIFHAAAHKHVPLMEHNPGEAVRNNVVGTRIVGEAAQAVGVEQFVLVSTDKAGNPTSVMGATTTISQLLVQGLDRRSPAQFTVGPVGEGGGGKRSVGALFARPDCSGGAPDP